MAANANDEPIAIEVKHNELSLHDRKAAYFMLCGAVVDGRLRHGAISQAAEQFSVHRRTISRLWETVGAKVNEHLNNQNNQQENHANNLLPNHLFESNRKGNCGRRQSWDRDALAVHVKSLPKKKRRTVRDLAAATNIPKSTIFRMMQSEGLFWRHTSRLKPTLTPENELSRFLYALNQIDPATNNLRTPKFLDMMDRVHIDEKWFFLCKDGESYYLVNDEEPPKRQTKHKSHIAKVMFIVAQARPRFVGEGGTYWDGKIGLWPFGKTVAAQRDSINRPAGTLEWENTNVDCDAYRSMLMNEIVPSIIDKWPAADYARLPTIYIQQDGAKSHIDPEEDEEWMEYMETLAVEEKITLYTQPPNSPDTNLNDLGFFAALQARYYAEAPGNSLEIISMVEKAFDEFDPKKINRIWLTYLSCLNQIIRNNGGNQYKIPHMKKDKLERENRLPLTLPVSNDAKAYL